DPARRYLWWLSVPMFALFAAFSLKTGGGELNWPVTAYLSGIVLAAVWLADQLSAQTAWYRRLAWACLLLFCGLGLTVSAMIYASERFPPLLERVVGPPTMAHPFPMRKVDPTSRLRGWRELAAEVDRVVADLRRRGIEPVLVGSRWTIPGALGVYGEGHPV